jgi:hypothetical protein
MQAWGMFDNLLASDVGRVVPIEDDGWCWWHAVACGINHLRKHPLPGAFPNPMLNREWTAEMLRSKELEVNPTDLMRSLQNTDVTPKSFEDSLKSADKARRWGDPHIDGRILTQLLNFTLLHITLRATHNKGHTSLYCMSSHPRTLALSHSPCPISHLDFFLVCVCVFNCFLSDEYISGNHGNGVFEDVVTVVQYDRHVNAFSPASPFVGYSICRYLLSGNNGGRYIEGPTVFAFQMAYDEFRTQLSKAVTLAKQKFSTLKQLRQANTPKQANPPKPDRFIKVLATTTVTTTTTTVTTSTAPMIMDTDMPDFKNLSITCKPLTFRGVTTNAPTNVVRIHPMNMKSPYSAILSPAPPTLVPIMEAFQIQIEFPNYNVLCHANTSVFIEMMRTLLNAAFTVHCAPFKFKTWNYAYPNGWYIRPLHYGLIMFLQIPSNVIESFGPAQAGWVSPPAFIGKQAWQLCNPVIDTPIDPITKKPKHPLLRLLTFHLQPPTK